MRRVGGKGGRRRAASLEVGLTEAKPLGKLRAGDPAPGSVEAGEKYQRILDAAIEVIAENGYFNSPVSAIAARAGVADGPSTCISRARMMCCARRSTRRLTASTSI